MNIRRMKQPIDVQTAGSLLSGPKNRGTLQTQCARSLTEYAAAAYHGGYYTELEVFYDLLPYGSGSLFQ